MAPPASLPLPNYRRLASWRDRWAAWERAGADLRPLATTAEGRTVVGLGVGPHDSPRVLLLAGVHAMEWIGVEVGAAIFERFLACRDALRTRVLYVPLLNMDGFARVEADLAAGRRAFRRTNTAGVDLNRNFPSHWRPQNRRGRLLPFLGHAGSAPRSEPEVDGLLRWLDAQPLSLLRALSLHSIGRRVLYPYGGRWTPPSDVAAHRQVADRLCAAFPERYRPSQCARWVPGAFAYGLEIDHFHDAYGAQSLLVECSGGGLRLGRPSTWLSPPRWYNPADPTPTVRGLAPPLADFLAPEVTGSVRGRRRVPGPSCPGA